MKLREIGPNVIQLTRLHVFNCYLVREDDGFTLIDTTTSGSGEDVLKAAQKCGASVRRIVLTHAHADHAGALDEIAQQLGEVEVLCSARESSLLAGDLRLLPDEPHTNVRGSFVPCKTPPTRFVDDGVYIKSLRVIDTKGHTPGHISLWDTRDGTVFAGDAFQTQGGVAIAGTVKPLFPLPALATWNRELSYQSGLRLREFSPARLAPGHGAVLEHPLKAMDQAIREAEKDVRSYRAA